jgi:hypothetical protein
MRKVIGGAFISLDGVVQAPGGPEEDTTGGFAHGGWMEPVFDEAVGHQVDTLFAGDFDLLLGRRTYDIFAAYGHVRRVNLQFLHFSRRGRMASVSGTKSSAIESPVREERFHQSRLFLRILGNVQRIGTLREF